MFHRLAGCWTYWGWKENFFKTEEDALAFYDEISYMLAMQICAPNSPQWINTGLYWAYGIDSLSEGYYYIDTKTKKIKESNSAYKRPQTHASFIFKVKDNLINEEGIMGLWQREAKIFKFSSGSGTNFSDVRSKYEYLSGGRKIFWSDECSKGRPVKT